MGPWAGPSLRNTGANDGSGFWSISSAMARLLAPRASIGLPPQQQLHVQHESGVTRLAPESLFGVCQVVLGVLERSGARYKYESSKRQSYSGLQFSRECLSRG